MQNILKENFSDLEKDFPYTIQGKDKEGRPLLLMDFGKWDINKAAQKGELDRVLRYFDRMMEEAEMEVAKMQSSGKNVTQWTWLVNQERTAHVNLPSARFYWYTANVLEQNHPAMASKLFLLNSPPVFNVVMKSVRPIMPSFSNDIFRMYGDESEWKNQVLDLVDASQLPPSYGGVKGLSKNNAKNNLLVGTFQKEDDGSWWWAKIFG
ncbi:retinal-binding protein [Folsomia candida]|uniref:Retinal-binding protein n=1 Tax=Folsomia candida TaxID=158441 RepID=A0A226F5P6_FOLCA|nr:retinal-binding protein [Folsomia candida]XP_035701972.1 retinal-binding protein [Folsomia candida]OXA64754.1 Retinal-binding protein [Folsomia candida]